MMDAWAAMINDYDVVIVTPAEAGTIKEWTARLHRKAVADAMVRKDTND